MDRLFLDANILFSAAHRPDGRMNRLWKPDRPGKTSSTSSTNELVTSRYAVEEANRNLATPTQRARLARLLQGMEVIDMPHSRKNAHPNSSAVSQLPEKDRPILEAAILCGATHLLTGDAKHFGALYGQWVDGVLVLPPASYLL